VAPKALRLFRYSFSSSSSMGPTLAEYTTIQMEDLQHNRRKQTSSSAISSQPHLFDYDVSTRNDFGNKAERKRKGGNAGFFLVKIRTSRAQCQPLFWHVLALCHVLEHACAALAIPVPAVTYRVIHSRARARAVSPFLTRVHLCVGTHTYTTRYSVYYRS